MKTKFKIWVLFFISPLSLFAQNSVDNLIATIEINNTSILALQKRAEAEKLDNKTGIYLQNPEVEFDYLIGKPSTMGNRTDFSITQSFNFPTAYYLQNKISDVKNIQTALELRKQQKSITLKARLLCYDLIYNNALQVEFSKRYQHAQNIANSYKSMFDLGEANVLDLNKAQLNLLNVENQLKTIELAQHTLLTELTTLNGGQKITLADTVFEQPNIPTDFEQWYEIAQQNNPIMSWLKHEIDKSIAQEKLNRALSLPKLKAGYMSESVVGTQYQGISIGISIPLWEDKNRVKYAKAHTIAMQGVEQDTKLQYYNSLKSLHANAITLQDNVNGFRRNLQLYNSSSLLQKAFEKGELSLAQYILELSANYESINTLLEMDRNLNKTVAQLYEFQ